MSYCVNCGVKLDDSIKKCPLCSTMVINPNLPYDFADKSTPTYPRASEENLLIKNKSATLMIVSAIFFIPAIICLVVNFVISQNFTWSIYALGGIITLWVVLVLPFVNKAPHPTILLAFDFATIIVYLYIIEKMTDLLINGKSWFLSIALPECIYVWLALFCIILLVQNYSISKLNLIATLLTLIGFNLLLTEIIVDLFLLNEINLEWSLISITICLSIAILCVIINRKQKIKTSIKKRMHI